MQYQKIHPAVFRARPNRFVAQVELAGETVTCHVKNTGRCRELLVPDAAVYLEKAANPARKTAYDLIAVEKGDLLINMDAQAPNRVFQEWAAQGHFLPDVQSIQPEYRYGDSRLDFALTTPVGLHLVEVKGRHPGGERRCPVSGRAHRAGRQAYSGTGEGGPGGHGGHLVLRHPDARCPLVLPQ